MSILDKLIEIVGEKYCSDKDYINVVYARSLDPLLEEIIPSYVILPATTEEVSEIVKIAKLEILEQWIKQGKNQN